MKPALARVWDSLYGLHPLDDYERQLILLPEVQRLRFVRLCNINSLLITGGSEISRFEHSLGVLRLAKEWLESQGIPPTSESSQALRAAAILHDIQTGPFGHSFQYVLEEREEDFSHDDVDHGLDARYFQDLDANASFSGRPFAARRLLGGLWGQVSRLIRGEGELGPLISGTVDFDNIDNVLRLAFHCGLYESAHDGLPLQLARAVSLQGRRICLRASDLPLVGDWQRYREILYEFLLLDWAEFSAKAMLTRAIELALQHEIVGVDSWILTDGELLSRLEHKGVGDAQAVAELVRRLRLGDLYSPVFIGTTPSIEKYRDLSSLEAKSKIESVLGRDARSGHRMKGGLIFHPILDVAKTRRSVEVGLTGSRETLELGSNSSQLLVGVFASAALRSELVTYRLSEMAQALLSDMGLRELRSVPDPMALHIRAQRGEQLRLL